MDDGRYRPDCAKLKNESNRPLKAAVSIGLGLCRSIACI
jgi:hypothetical protein